MDDLISVIVTVYKVEKYLDQCVESIVNQTYKNLEIILVDDGSPDNCPQMCDDWAKKDSRIKVIHKQNGGLSDARNAGLDIAQGEYIAFIDSDDLIHRDFFSITHKFSVENNADIVSLDLFDFFDGQNVDVTYDYSIDNLNVRTFNKIEILKEYFAPQNKQVIYHGLCMKLYKRKCFDGLKFEAGRLHEDLYITYKLLDKANKFIFLPLKFYFYNRSNPNSICTSYKYKNFIDENDAVVGMLGYFANDAEIIDYVRRFAVGHFCYLVSRTDVVVPTSDFEKYEQMRQQMLDYIRQNRNYIYSDKNRSLKSKFGFWLMLTNYEVYRVVKKVWNVVTRKE